MNRIIILVLIAAGTFLLILFVQKPEILSEIWMWLVGFAGGAVALYRKFKEFVSKNWNDSKPANPEPSQPVPGLNQLPNESSTFEGTTITLLRYASDENTTIGLLYLNNVYFSYTLEDAFHEIKVPGKTRIPPNTYSLDFRRVDSPLTLKYRNKYPDWFTYHIEIKNIPDFSTVYIHSGGDHTDTEGCVLVSDSINMSDANTFLTNSRTTFKRLYQLISNDLNNGKKVRMIIKDENWFTQSMAS